MLGGGEGGEEAGWICIHSDAYYSKHSPRYAWKKLRNYGFVHVQYIAYYYIHYLNAALVFIAERSMLGNMK